jgi:RNAse (barnase) inhibitor barstar
MVIDLKEITSIQHLHGIFKKQLGFPDFYGNNWDAFWDAITGLVEIPETLVLSGSAYFAATFPADHKILSRIIQEYNDNYAKFSGSKIELT